MGSTTAQEFVVQVSDGETFEGLVAAGKYHGKDKGITADWFPIRESAPGERKLVLLHFGEDIRSLGAIAEAAKLGLERPTYEDALRFGAQYPGVVQGNFPVAFLHEPVQVCGGPHVLCFGRDDGRRYLDHRWFRGGWSGSYRFAFVRSVS